MAQSKYLEIAIIDSKGKTNVYTVDNKCLSYRVGIIKWACNFRKYAFYPENNMQYDSKCLMDIGYILNELMLEHKKRVDING